MAEDYTKLRPVSSLAVSELGGSLNRSNTKQIITDAWRCYQNGEYKKMMQI